MLSLHAGSAVTAAFLASLVEAVEALTIVLAVAVVRGVRPAILGAVAGLVAVALIVVALGPLLDRVPLNVLQIAIGVLLLLFGMRWPRKATCAPPDTFRCMTRPLRLPARRKSYTRRRVVTKSASTGLPALRASRLCSSKASRWCSSSLRSRPAAACCGR